MTEMPSEAEWLRDSKSHLVQLKDELALSDGEIAIVDRGIAALDALFETLTINAR
jgi:hypothetical protein